MPSFRPRPCLSGVLCLGFLALQCTEPPEGDVEPGRVEQPIKGGEPSSRGYVVGIAIQFPQGFATCTGSLLSPNLVLTAQHCVAPIDIAESFCDSSFGGPVPAANIHVTPNVSLDTGTFVDASEVVVVPGGNTVCGFDMAAIILATNLDAPTIEPRLDAPPVAGDVYTAVGYGLTDSAQPEPLERRERTGLSIECVGSDCRSSLQIAATEWRGEAGVCEGDSGGPAIAADETVVGVASRGAVGCEDPTYTSVPAFSEWLRTTAQHAAELGDYPLPEWAAGSTGEGGAGGSTASDGGAGGGGAPAEGPGGSGGDVEGGGRDSGGGDSSPDTDDGCSCKSSTGRDPAQSPLTLMMVLLIGWWSRRVNRR
ncbi:MAG: S1 family peptidase [Polyangiaceae bacterium]|nr:S1 family peptidase [Polyangiaceae bacterium]